jgi:hypothetical protein
VAEEVQSRPWAGWLLRIHPASESILSIKAWCHDGETSGRRELPPARDGVGAAHNPTGAHADGRQSLHFHLEEVSSVRAEHFQGRTLRRAEITQGLQINDVTPRVGAIGLRAPEIVEGLGRLTMDRQPVLRARDRDRLEVVVRASWRGFETAWPSFASGAAIRPVLLSDIWRVKLTRERVNWSCGTPLRGVIVLPKHQAP